jgi:hypothetical protein
MKTRNTKATVALITLLCLWQTPQIPAMGLLGVDVTSGSSGLTSGYGGLTLGWEFQVSAPEGILVNGLGFWDEGSDGFFLGQTFDVGLWDPSTGSQLGESVITSSSTLVPSLATDGGWRVNPISPLYLPPGLYRIGALMPVMGANPIICEPATFQSGPGVSLVRFLRQIGSPTLAMPDIGPPYPGAVWFGPTFTFTPVPEPSSISLLCAGLSLLSVFGVFKRKVLKRAASHLR